MGDHRLTRLVEIVLRGYPPRWRQRYGEEAAELAGLLLRDGTPARSIALSYLVGAGRAWFTPPPGRRLSRAACALLAAVCLVGVVAGLEASTVPARASTGSAHCRSNSPTSAPRGTPGHGRSC